MQDKIETIIVMKYILKCHNEFKHELTAGSDLYVLVCAVYSSSLVKCRHSRQCSQHTVIAIHTRISAAVLPGRIDIGRHFILTGGLLGLKESHEKLVSRVLSFGRYIFQPDEYVRFLSLLRYLSLGFSE